VFLYVYVSDLQVWRATGAEKENLGQTRVYRTCPVFGHRAEFVYLRF
jgi:hypothetical protein